MIATELRQKFPLRMLLQILKLSRSTFYYHLKQNKQDKYFYAKQKFCDCLRTLEFSAFAVKKFSAAN